VNRIVAYCGLVCSECEAYVATQASDELAKERIAAKWRTEYNAPAMTVADVTCDGCVSVSGRLGGYCPACPIRACGVEHGVANCAHCADYASCEKLSPFLAQVPPAQATLEAIRQGLL
jgi:hypothetical protein